MGHHELGRLSGSRKWRQVIALISGGADVQDVAAATSAAAESQMIDASNDPAVKHAVWLLTQIPIAAKQEDFASELRKLGLNVSDRPSLIQVVAAMMEAVDRHVGRFGGRTDLGEMAQRDFVDSLAGAVDELTAVPPVMRRLNPMSTRRSRAPKSAKIRTLNDRFRKSLTGGRVMMTAAVSALPDDVRARAMKLSRTFDNFTPDNDPHNEHDFGSFEIDDQKFIFKHDSHDKSMQYGSEDPEDPKKTTRVLTIMLTNEY